MTSSKNRHATKPSKERKKELRLTLYLLVVLGAGRWHVVDVLGGWKVSRDVILIFPCVVHVHLANPCGNNHLRERKRKSEDKIIAWVCLN